MSKLTHLDDAGAAHMVDVGGKAETQRRAVASGQIAMSAEALEAIRAGNAPKGDVLGTARIAGIMAAKRTGELIPLCHPLGLEAVNIDFAFEDDGIRATATASLTGKTGVEMEAMTAACVALLTIYDMAKAIDKGMVIGEVRLIAKSGGKSGDWKAPDSRKPDEQAHIDPMSQWFSLQDLLGLRLDGLPTEKRTLNRYVERNLWRKRHDHTGNELFRKRSGRGGGYVYHYGLLPSSAQIDLLQRGLYPDPSINSLIEYQGRGGRWAWYLSQGEKAKGEAKRRLSIVLEVMIQTRSGTSKSAAVATTSAKYSISVSTLWNWLHRVNGHCLNDMLPALAPRSRAPTTLE